VSTALFYASAIIANAEPLAPLAGAGLDAATLDAGSEAAAELLSQIAARYPRLGLVLLCLGALRLVAKPIIASLHRAAEKSGKPEDLALVERVENSFWTRAALFLLDWLASIKIRRR
jgi:hypothetical protein